MSWNKTALYKIIYITCLEVNLYPEPSADCIVTRVWRLCDSWCEMITSRSLLLELPSLLAQAH